MRYLRRRVKPEGGKKRYFHHEDHEGHEVRNSILSETFVIFVSFVVSLLVRLFSQAELAQDAFQRFKVGQRS